MRLFIFGLFILLLTGPAMAGRIVFEPSIEVGPHAELSLADLARVEGADAEVLRELGRFKWTGDRMSDLHDVLRQWRSERSFRGVAQWSMVIPASVKVDRKETFSTEEFRRKTLNLLGVVCATCRFDLISVGHVKGTIAPDWRIDDSALQVAGSLLVPVLSSAGTQWIPLRLRVYRTVATLNHTVESGQTLTVADVEMREVDVTKLRDVFESVAELTDHRALRILPAGHILSRNDVKRDEDVRRGQAVRISAGSDEFELTLSGTAEEGGRVGDLIKVKNPSSGKVLSAVVTEKGSVRLQ